MKRQLQDFTIIAPISLLATMVLHELVGQNLLFRDKMWYVNDVGYCPEPGSEPVFNSDPIRSRREAETISTAVYRYGQQAGCFDS